MTYERIIRRRYIGILQELNLLGSGEGGERIVHIERFEFRRSAQKGMLQLAPLRAREQPRTRNPRPDPVAGGMRQHVVVSAESLIEQVEPISAVAGEQLVASLPCQDHFDFLRREAGDKIERHAGWPDDRLIFM